VKLSTVGWLLSLFLQAVEAFQALRAANNPEALSRHYRLYVTACSAAVRARNYQAANE
jgi:cyclopropane fatty-acyl-phospholipid synthase-like methyltransferase